MKDIGASFTHLSMDAKCELAINKLDVSKVVLSKTLASRLKRRAVSDPDSANDHVAQEILATLSESKKDLDKVQLRRLQYDQSQHVPAEVQLLIDARAMLRAPQYTHGEHMHSHVEASEMLRRKFLALPTYTARHETALMGRQAGTWELVGVGPRTYPPCVYGTQCVGHSSPAIINGLTERVIFMRAMSEEEWDTLVRTGAQPIGTHPCVLCHRLHTTRYAAKARMGLRPGHAMADGAAAAEVVFQLWRNLVSVEGGYWTQYVFYPAENEILIEPIVAFHRSALTAHRMPNGMWRIDQQVMVWRAPELLERVTVGERAQDFCSGADSTKKPMPSISLGPSAFAPLSLTGPAAAVCSATTGLSSTEENRK